MVVAARGVHQANASSYFDTSRASQDTPHRLRVDSHRTSRPLANMSVHRRGSELGSSNCDGGLKIGPHGLLASPCFPVCDCGGGAGTKHCDRCRRSSLHRNTMPLRFPDASTLKFKNQDSLRCMGCHNFARCCLKGVNQTSFDKDLQTGTKHAEYMPCLDAFELSYNNTQGYMKQDSIAQVPLPKFLNV